MIQYREMLKNSDRRNEKMIKELNNTIDELTEEIKTPDLFKNLYKAKRKKQDKAD